MLLRLGETRDMFRGQRYIYIYNVSQGNDEIVTTKFSMAN